MRIWPMMKKLVRYVLTLFLIPVYRVPTLFCLYCRVMSQTHCLMIRIRLSQRSRVNSSNAIRSKRNMGICTLPSWTRKMRISILLWPWRKWTIGLATVYVGLWFFLIGVVRHTYLTCLAHWWCGHWNPTSQVKVWSWPPKQEVITYSSPYAGFPDWSYSILNLYGRFGVGYESWIAWIACSSTSWPSGPTRPHWCSSWPFHPTLPGGPAREVIVSTLSSGTCWGVWHRWIFRLYPFHTWQEVSNPKAPHWWRDFWLPPDQRGGSWGRTTGWFGPQACYHQGSFPRCTEVSPQTW